MTKITTAEELDALPVGSVVRDRDRDEWTKRATPPVWVTPETRPFAFGSEDVARIWAPLTLVSRPDAPTAVVVKRFGDYDLALHVDGSVTWRDTGRVPVLPAAPAAEDRECRDCGRSDGGCDRDVEGAPVVSAEQRAALIRDARQTARFLTGCIESGNPALARSALRNAAESLVPLVVRLADALAAAGPLVTPEHDAQVAARASFSAWHHGWAAGWKDHQRRTDDLDAYAQEGSTPNPYRIERQDVTR